MALESLHVKRRPLKDIVKLGLGAGLTFCFRGKAKRIREQFTLSQAPRSRVDSLIHQYLASREGSLEEIHRAFWGKTGWYFGIVSNHVEEVYIPAYGELVLALAPVLAEHGIQTVCEWGTGDGKWLHYLSQQWAGLSRFIGIDISEAQIGRDRNAFPQLE